MNIAKDTKGRPISKKSISRSMLLSLVAGGFGSVWFLFTSPSQLLTILVKNNLGASSVELGFFLGAMNMISMFHLVAILIYARRKTIKPFYLTMSFIHRSQTFLIAAASFYAAFGGDRRVALYTIMGSSLLTFILGNTAGSGWWAWFNSIVPSNRRSAYFGKRSALAQSSNVITFFLATIALDVFSRQAFYAFGVIYLIAGVFGIIEPILHLSVPEPASTMAGKVKLRPSTFFQPFSDPNFRTHCIVAGVSLMGINISAPFFVPMITDPMKIGAPNIWLGIIFAISQIMWVIMIPFWGTMMDRFGRKPVTMVGMLFPLSYIGYLFLTPQNYHIMLPLIALVGGFFSPAMYEGLNQVMLSLVPKRNQTAYIAWYWALLGMIQGLGPVFGGYLLETTGSISLLVFSTLSTIFLAFILFSTVKTGKELKFSALMSTISSPGILKAYFNIPIIGKSTDRNKVEKALSTMRSSQGSLALEEIVIRLDDADSEVREEAVKALGRIGGADAEQVLISYLQSRDSLVRIECARALGRLGSRTAVPVLIDVLYEEDERLVEAAARALGKIDSEESSGALMTLINEPRSVMVKVTSAEGLSGKQERLVILQKILSLYDQATNPVIRKQLLIAIGNIIGRSGEFYTYLTGTELAREEAVTKLFRSVSRHLKGLERTNRGMIDHIVFDTLPKAVACYETEDHEGAYRNIYTILMNLIYREITLHGEQITITDDHIELLAKNTPRLYAAYTLLMWYEKLYSEDTSAITSAELLLLFYALRYYRVPYSQKQPRDKNPTRRS